MSFRQRLMLFTALAIAVTFAGASFAVWVVAKHELYAQLYQTVAQQVNQSGPFGGGSLYTVVIHPDGDRTGPLAGVLPYTKQVAEVVAGKSDGYFTDLTKIICAPPFLTSMPVTSTASFIFPTRISRAG